MELFKERRINAGLFTLRENRKCNPASDDADVMIVSYLAIILGSQRLRSGTSNKINRKTTSVTRNGVAPFRRSPDFILKTFRIKYKFTPIGGVISPISRFTTYKIPNQTRSNPSEASKGAKMGTVNMVMVIESKREPRIR